MRRFLLLILLFATTSASAEVIRLDCPTSRADFDFFSHNWVLDLDGMQATLSGQQSPWLEPGKHKIFKVTKDAIFIMKDSDERVFWKVDRYTLESSLHYETTREGYLLSKRCNISEKQF